MISIKRGTSAIRPHRGHGALPSKRVRSNLCLWPQAAVEECLLFRRCQGRSRHLENGAKTTLMTQLRHGRLKTFRAQKHCSFLR